MLRNLAFVVGYAVIQVLSATASVWAADFGTAQEAKAMLERAVAAVKEDKAKALDMFNNGEGGFKDRDLYVWCANASDGIVTAQPYMNKGKQLRDIKGKHGSPFGETIMQNATEGTIKETTYWWPRPGEDEPFQLKSPMFLEHNSCVLGMLPKFFAIGSGYRRDESVNVGHCFSDATSEEERGSPMSADGTEAWPPNVCK